MAKLTVKDKLKAAISNAYESNDLDKTNSISDQLERRLALQRVKPRAKKLRERIGTQSCNCLDETSDPNSDVDVGS